MGPFPHRIVPAPTGAVKPAVVGSGNTIGTLLRQFYPVSPPADINNRLIEPDGREGLTCGEIECAQRLGGMLRFYRRAGCVADSRDIPQPQHRSLRLLNSTESD